MELLEIWEILLRRKRVIIALFLVFFFTVVIGTHLLTPAYRARAKLLITSSDTTATLMMTLGLEGLGRASTDNYETDIALATIKPLVEELISSLDIRNRRGDRIKAEKLVNPGLLAKVFPRPYVSVDQYEDADMLEIVATSPDPAQAAVMANTLADLYVKDRIKKTIGEYRAARAFIQTQIEDVKQEYFKSLDEMKDFMIKEQTVDLTSETENLINKILTLRSDYDDNERSIVTLEKELALAKEQLKSIEEFRKDSKDFVESDQINSLKSRLNEALIQIAKNSLEITKEHPDYKELEKELETLRVLIKSEAEIVFHSERFSIDPQYDELSQSLVSDYISKEVALTKNKLLKTYIDRYQKQLMKIPAMRVESSKLDLSLSVNRSVYEKLLQFLTEIGIAESINLCHIKVVEAATKPYKPHFPKKPLNYLFGLFFGVIWALAMGFVIDYVDNAIKSRKTASAT
ncbi:GumC family protein [Verrucomicrobiota bacterium]